MFFVFHDPQSGDFVVILNDSSGGLFADKVIPCIVCFFGCIKAVKSVDKVNISAAIVPHNGDFPIAGYAKVVAVIRFEEFPAADALEVDSVVFHICIPFVLPGVGRVVLLCF